MRTLLGACALLLLICSPAMAQNVLTEADMVAAVDSVCACDAGEEVAPEAEESEEEDGNVAAGKCISRLAKLRQAVRTMAFFGAVEEFDVKAFVKARKKECKGAKKAGKGPKGPKGGEEETTE